MKKEIWDLYDRDRNLTDEVVIRGQSTKLPPNRYHLCVECVVSDRDGNVLITKRSEEKRCPLQWEFTAGSAVSGENSMQAVIREVAEETGLSIQEENIVLLQTEKTDNTFRDTYTAFVDHINLDDVHLQEGETVDKNKISFTDFVFGTYSHNDNAPFLPLQRSRMISLWGAVINANKKHFGIKDEPLKEAAPKTKRRKPKASDSLI